MLGYCSCLSLAPLSPMKICKTRRYNAAWLDSVIVCSVIIPSYDELRVYTLAYLTDSVVDHVLTFKVELRVFRGAFVVFANDAGLTSSVIREVHKMDCHLAPSV